MNHSYKIVNRQIYKPSINSDKPIILLTANIISGIKLWSNGLHQNSLFLYKLFELAGYFPIFITVDICVSDETNQYRLINFIEFYKNPFKIYALVEIGINCNNKDRLLFKKNGAKLFKLFLGNILNVDIEIPIHTDLVVQQHNIGSYETLLISPHYNLSREYTSSVYNVDKPVLNAPYVWDPSLIHDLSGIYCWSNEGPYSFTIMEPNISFQKCSLIPIMICEAYYREHPEKMDGAVVINGDKFTDSTYFSDNVLSSLDLNKDKRLFLIKRLTIRDAATCFKQNIIICHAVNNDYNYLFLEYLFMGFPVLHNYAMLKDYGYYYNSNDIEAGKNMIDFVINTHGSNLETYKITNMKLFWKFSIQNPENIKGWKNIIDF